MADERLKRPRDPSQRAKLIVDIATGEVKDVDSEAAKKDPADQGDSGSLVIARLPNNQPVAVGLVFAVSPDKVLTHVAPLSKVFDALELGLVSGHNI